LSKFVDLFRSQDSRLYEKGQLILHQSDKTDNTFYIKKGYVKVFTISDDGEEHIVLILKKGDVFPIVWSFENVDKLIYFYGALTDADLYVVTGRNFLKLVAANPRVSVAVLKYFLKSNRALLARLKSVESNKADGKVASIFPYLIERCGKRIGPKKYEIKIPLTHQEIASMVGLTRETTSIQMKKLEKAGVIDQDNSNLVINTAKLDAEDSVVDI